MSPENKTHVAEVIQQDMGLTHAERDLAAKIEQAYGRLSASAILNNMVILNTFQQTATVGRVLCVIIVVQWVSRVDLQEAQMREILKGQLPGKA